LPRLTHYEKLLVLFFLLSLPFINPWVRGDGVGYYAYARSMLIEHHLDFTKDWLSANSSYRLGRVDAAGNILPSEYTRTGHLDNHFAIGPAILWAPLLIVAHAGVVLWDKLGGHVAPDGYSRPYLLAMALGTVLYGFLSLLISFRVARLYISERWAFLATLGIWLGSSLPVYMYFNPSWSHAHSAFSVALFLWYWIRTRNARTWVQWMVLGALGGLMMDVYYVTAALLLLPLMESLAGYWSAFKGSASEPASHLFFKNVVFSAFLLASLAPTFITKKIIYGSYLDFGYRVNWFWKSPAFFKVCFSAEHGLFSWTPILSFSILGLFALAKFQRVLALRLMVVFVAFVYAIGCYSDWHGISSYGSRFFVGLTPIFILGLAAFFGWFSHSFQEQRAALVAWGATTALVVWNLGLIFQWGTHLIPERGPVSWRAAAYNQVTAVPEQAVTTMRLYLTSRRMLMDHIEQEDLKQVLSGPQADPDAGHD